MKYRHFLSALLCICLLLSACGAEAPAEYGMDNEQVQMDAEAPAEITEELKTDASTLSSVPTGQRKLIKTVSMDAETEDYDALIAALEEKIAALSGYTESRRTGTYSRERRWCSMTVRIPAENLSSFVSHVTDQANVLSTTETTEDVTLQYTDTEAKIAALETEQARLLELLAGAQNLSEILEIEARLSDVTYELERYASQKRSYDNLVTYATVNLTIEEVRVLTPVEEPTVWNRISTGFMESLEGVGSGLVDFFVWLIVSSPYLAVWAVVLTIAFPLVRKLRRKGQKTKHAPANDTPPAP